MNDFWHAEDISAVYACYGNMRRCNFLVQYTDYIPYWVCCCVASFCTLMFEPLSLQHMSWRYHTMPLNPQSPIHPNSIHQCWNARTSAASALTSSWPGMWSCPYGRADSSRAISSAGGRSTIRNGIM